MLARVVQEQEAERRCAVRAVECPCGEHLEGRNDDELVQAARDHNSDAHPDQYQDWELRQLVTTTAYDTAA